MSRLFNNLLIFFAIALGLACGFWNISFINETANHVSDLFLRLLKLVSLPLIFLAIASTISGMKDFQEMRKMGRKVVFYTFGTTISAATIALILYLTINPANKIDVPLESVSEATKNNASYFTFLLNIIPSNILQVFVESNVMGIAFLAGLFSFATLCLPEKQKNTLHELFASLLGMMLKVTSFIITLMPLAVFAFAILLVRDLRTHFDHVSTLFFYLLCVVFANFAQGLIVLPLLLK